MDPKLESIVERDFAQPYSRPKNILPHDKDAITRIAPSAIRDFVPMAQDSLLRQLFL
jgi:hypothetical protein